MNEAETVVNEVEKPIREEGRTGAAASMRKVSRKPSARPRTNASTMTVVDVALAAAQKNREGRLKARAMLKNARLLISKGRLNR